MPPAPLRARWTGTPPLFAQIRRVSMASVRLGGAGGAARGGPRVAADERGGDRDAPRAGRQEHADGREADRAVGRHGAGAERAAAGLPGGGGAQLQAPAPARRARTYARARDGDAAADRGHAGGEPGG